MQPNVTDTDLVYTIVDTVPDGLTIDPASVTAGGVVDGQTITWEVTMPTAVGRGRHVRGVDARHQPAVRRVGRVPRSSARVGAARSPTSTATPWPSGPTATSGRSSSTARQFANLVVAEDGIVTVTGGYGGEPWDAAGDPVARLAERRVRAAVVRPRDCRVADGSGIRLAQISSARRGGHPVGRPLRVHRADDTVGPSVGTFQAWIYNTVEDFRPEMTFEYAGSRRPAGDRDDRRRGHPRRATRLPCSPPGIRAPC